MLACPAVSISSPLEQGYEMQRLMAFQSHLASDGITQLLVHKAKHHMPRSAVALGESELEGQMIATTPSLR